MLLLVKGQIFKYFQKINERSREGARIILQAQIESEKSTKQILVTFDPKGQTLWVTSGYLEHAPIAFKIGMEVLQSLQNNMKTFLSTSGSHIKCYFRSKVKFLNIFKKSLKIKGRCQNYFTLAQIDSEKNTEQIKVTFDPKGQTLWVKGQIYKMLRLT